MCAYYALFVVYIAVFDSGSSTPLQIEHSHHYQDVVRSNSADAEASGSLGSYPIAPSPLGLASHHALPERAEAVQALGARNSSLSGSAGPAHLTGCSSTPLFGEVRRNPRYADVNSGGRIVDVCLCCSHTEKHRCCFGTPQDLDTPCSSTGLFGTVQSWRAMCMF